MPVNLLLFFRSSAKAGLVGLSHTLSREGARSGIHSNVVVPLAASRLTAGLLPPGMVLIAQHVLVRILFVEIRQEIERDC